VVVGRYLLTNAVAFQRFNSRLDARLDVVRQGEHRTVQGVEIVATDILARNGVVHGIAGFIPEEMELPDDDQSALGYQHFLTETIREGSRLYSQQQFPAATDYFARRNYEFRARYSSRLRSLYGIQAEKILNNDRVRNRHYDFASTAWQQRNKFRNLLRELEKQTPRLIDEWNFRTEFMRTLAPEHP
jgi:hypothetical protein